jgi:hypothetical protein
LITTSQIIKQFEGFLKIPNLFKDDTILNVDPFWTDEKIDLSIIDETSLKLSKQKYLGKRAELYLLQYLISSDRYSKITHSFQIHDNTTTIGEVDVICFDKIQQKWIHIELVSKLYVFTGNDDYDDFTQWIGPNLKDRLDFKIDKLKSHQLPLGKHPEILKLINSSEIESYCCYKAKLFLKSQGEKMKSNILNKKCVSGSYLNFEEFLQHKHTKDLFYVPEKKDWLCDLTQHETWYNFDRADTLLKPSIKDKRARLVWRKTVNGDYFEDFVVWW